MSELALKLIQKAKDTRATHLDLGNCGLSELLDALFELVDLKVLCTPPQYFFILFCFLSKVC